MDRLVRLRCKLVLMGLIVLLSVGLFGASRLVDAQNGTLTLDWWTIDNGGAVELVAGSYTLDGTIAQPDATTALNTGTLTLEGGFWERTETRVVYLPLIVAHR